MNHFARPLLPGNRNYPQKFGERLNQRVLVNILEHEEANRAISGGNDQRGIHNRSVIGHQQRAAASRNVLRAANIHAINRMGREPQDQPRQRIRQQPHGVDRCSERNYRRSRKKCPQPYVQIVGTSRVDRRSRHHSGKRKPIRVGDHSAFFGFVGAMLDQRVDWHYKESAGKAERGEQTQNWNKRQSRSG